MKKFVVYLLIFIAVVTLAVFLYSFSYNLAYGQLEKYESYDPVTGTFNETKYMLEEASPEIRAAGQKLLNEIGERLAFGFSTGFTQDTTDSQKQELTDIAAEFYGLVAKEDPEVFELMQQLPDDGDT